MAKLNVTPVAGEKEGEGEPGGLRFAAIVRSVLDSLGRPKDFLRATVRQVKDDTFRVNVLTGTDTTSVRITHSYFLTADADGRVTGSDPAIRKSY